MTDIPESPIPDAARAEHTRWIERRGYPLPPGAALDDSERRLIDRYGYWLHALALGWIAPVTPDQERFVRVAAGQAPATTPFEIAWLKCRQGASSPSPVKEVELADRLARVEAARVAHQVLREEYESRRAAILGLVAPQLDALESDFGPRLKALGDEAARVEADAKGAILEYGAPFTYGRVHARYQRGRITWDTSGLGKYMESHPEIAAYRRVGKPYVVLVLRGTTPKPETERADPT